MNNKIFTIIRDKHGKSLLLEEDNLKSLILGGLPKESLLDEYGVIIAWRQYRELHDEMMQYMVDVRQIGADI